jgi:hypothetical protein
MGASALVKALSFVHREFDSLSPHDVKGNCKKAFDAGEALGIPRVIEPADMDVLTVPDKLAVMTYLYQLRAHFTGEVVRSKLLFVKYDLQSVCFKIYSLSYITTLENQVFILRCTLCKA